MSPENRPENWKLPSILTTIKTNTSKGDETPRNLSGATVESVTEAASIASCKLPTSTEPVDIEKAMGLRARALERRRKMFGSDTENLYSPLVEFIAVSRT
jgi:hypothetical protein